MSRWGTWPVRQSCVASGRRCLDHLGRPSDAPDLPLFRDIYSTSIGRGLFLLTLSSAGPILAFASIESLKAGPKLPGLAWLPFFSFAVGPIYGQSEKCCSAAGVPAPRA